jgi:Na+/melibiose symporter-like transporter
MIFFQFKYLKGDFFLNITVATVSECFAYFISGVAQERLGIKKCYLIYFSMAAVGALLYVIFGTVHELLIPILLILTAYGISSACVTNWLSNAKLFPVIFTSTTHGICSFFARLGNIMSP